jgi:hypothetical protein
VLELSVQYGSGALLAQGGTGYAYNNLFGVGNFGTLSYDTLGINFSQDLTGTGSGVGAPYSTETGLCEGNCPEYTYSQVNEFIEDAADYEDKTDPCWDWQRINILTDYSNVKCATSIYNPEIQIPNPSGGTMPDPARLCECGNWNTESWQYQIGCSNTELANYFCPPIFYPTTPDKTGQDWCGGSVFDTRAPNITRSFLSAYEDTITLGEWSDFFPTSSISFSATPVIASLRRTRRDHRKSIQKFKMRFTFVPPPSCYLKIWTRAKIELYHTPEEGACEPNQKLSENIVDWAPIEWAGESGNCMPTAGYPYSGNEVTLDYVHEELGNEISFFEEGDFGILSEPEELYGVTCGHLKTLRLAFKYSWIKDYEPEWGCYTFYNEDVAYCGIYDQFSDEITESTCINHEGLAEPICHNV